MRSKYSDDTSYHERMEHSVEPSANESPRRASKPKTGTVFNCQRLNVREEPSSSGKVLMVVNAGTKLTLNTFSNRTFVGITTPTGETGYVMKKYLRVEN